jgi:hypothetical protein
MAVSSVMALLPAPELMIVVVEACGDHQEQRSIPLNLARTSKALLPFAINRLWKTTTMLVTSTNCHRRLFDVVTHPKRAALLQSLSISNANSNYRYGSSDRIEVPPDISSALHRVTDGILARHWQHQLLQRLERGYPDAVVLAILLCVPNIKRLCIVANGTFGAGALNFAIWTAIRLKLLQLN